MALRAHALLVLLAAIGCGRGEPVAPRTAVPPPPVARQDRDALLVAALPVESGGVTIVYDVRGPAGIGGELRAHARAGGWRRESWRLRVAEREIAGEHLITPELVYRSDADGRALVHAPLGALADAWLAAPGPTRAAVLGHVERWTAALAQARREQPGPTREIAGATCAVLTVGGAELCVWEAAGLPLAYRGEAFELTARQIDRGVEHDAAIFAVPQDLVATPAAGAAPSPEARLERLARGDVRELAALTLPPALTGTF